MSITATLKLKPDTSTLVQAQTWLEHCATKQRWPSRTAFALQLSMDEALTNTLMYGFTQDIDDTAAITLTLATENTFITLEIIDNGMQFDPTQKIPDELVSCLDDARPGGHGLRLMRHYLHDVRYTFTDGHNHLRLVAALDRP